MARSAVASAVLLAGREAPPEVLSRPVIKPSFARLSVPSRCAARALGTWQTTSRGPSALPVPRARGDRERGNSVGRLHASRFLGCLIGDELRVDVDRDLERPELGLDQGFDVLPFEAADSGCQARQGDAAKLLVFDQLPQFVQCVVDVLGPGATRVSTDLAWSILGEEVRDAPAAPMLVDTLP